MKKLLSLLFAATFASAVYAADPVPLFNAVLAIGKDHRFVLVSGAGKSSSFLRVGESFDGYTIKDYDTKTGELTLEKDGKATKVTLAADAANPGVTATSTPATVADAKAVLDAMHFSEMMDRTMAGVRKQQMKMIDAMMNQFGGKGANKDDVVAFQKKMVNEIMSAITGDEVKDDVAKVYADVFSKEQLQELGAFYASPLGQAFSDKQPELAEKMNAVMMPRMMAVMPKIRQMTQEFGQEMNAKKAAAAAAAAESGAAPAPAPKP